MDLTNKILRADDTVEEVTDAALNERQPSCTWGPLRWCGWRSSVATRWWRGS